MERLSRDVPDSVVINQCRFCRRIKEGKIFSKMRKDSLSRAIRIGMKLQCEVKVKNYDAKNADAVMIYTVEDEKVNVPKHVSIKIKYETCQRCYRISAGYYEAVVQLRGDFNKMEKLEGRIKRYVERRGGFITKTEKTDYGLDIYASDKMMMNEFFKDYNLKPKRSFRLYGVRRGRKLYRNTYSLHL